MEVLSSPELMVSSLRKISPPKFRPQKQTEHVLLVYWYLQVDNLILPLRKSSHAEGYFVGLMKTAQLIKPTVFAIVAQLSSSTVVDR